MSLVETSSSSDNIITWSSPFCKVQDFIHFCFDHHLKVSLVNKLKTTKHGNMCHRVRAAFVNALPRDTGRCQACSGHAETVRYKVSKRMQNSSRRILVVRRRLDKEAPRYKQASLWCEADGGWKCWQRGSEIPAGRSRILPECVVLYTRPYFTDGGTWRTVVFQCQNYYP